jgi:amphi-Trp domain-containing protein
MSQSEKYFWHESLHDKDSIQAILKAITQGVAKGRLTLSDEEGEVVLNPEGLLQLKVTATQDVDSHSLSLKIAWQVENNRSKSSGTLKVKSK